MCKGTRISKNWMDEKLITEINSLIENFKNEEGYDLYDVERDEKIEVEKSVRGLKSKLESMNKSLTTAFLISPIIN